MANVKNNAEWLKSVENVKKYTLLKLRELQSVSFVEIDPSSSYALVSFVDGR